MMSYFIPPARRIKSGLAPVVLAVVALATLAACGDDDETSTTTTTRAGVVTTQAPTATTAVRTGNEPTLRAMLTGAVEIPGPGDPAATGGAIIVVGAPESQVCWELNASGLNPAADKAHIHRGVAGQAGPVVVTLTPPAADNAVVTGCANADAALITELTNNPQGFYVNLHNTPYPDGAIRGQLARDN